MWKIISETREMRREKSSGKIEDLMRMKQEGSCEARRI